MDFYFHPSPNPLKVALLLEELGADYTVKPIDTFKGEQHLNEFTALNPNAKLPVLVDGDQTVFDSNAILLYLADKTGKFGGTASMHGDVLSWLMFVATGLSPFSGQAVHFLHHAPEDLPYAKNRYVKEVERHYGVLDAHLSKHAYLAGSGYTVADMALWGWMNFAPYILGEAGLSSYPNVERLWAEISDRDAAKRVDALKQRYSFKEDLDAEARAALFPQNEKA